MLNLKMLYLQEEVYEMEERGIVAAKDGSKPRKCLITREEWEEMKKSTEGMA